MVSPRRPTQAHARLRLMPIEADESALGAINRPYGPILLHLVSSGASIREEAS